MENTEKSPNKNDNSSVNTKPNELDKKIDLIENQIHSLNIKLNTPKKEKWWKKNSSLIISIIALVTSIGFTIHNLRKEDNANKEKTINDRTKKIESLTLELTELSEKQVKLASENPNVDLNNLNSLVNYRRAIYIKEIVKLMDDFNENFPPGIYDIVGNELRNEGNYKEALKLYRKGYSQSISPNEKVIAYRNLGRLYGIQNTPIFQPDSSNFYWKRSVKESEKISGEQKFINKGQSYQLWAGDEFYKGNSEFARKLIDSARFQYSLLPENNQNKHYAIGQLIQMIEFDKRKDLNKMFFGLNGEWETVGNTNFKSEINFFKNANGWFCSLEIYKNRKLEYSLSGPFISLNDDHIKFNLQGMKKLEFPTPYNDRISVFASIKFSITNDDNLNVTLNEINGKKRQFEIKKK